MDTKYEPLRTHLANIQATEWRATFAEIEEILGTTLPMSARNYPAWWANDDTPSRHSRAWLDAGWWTSDINLTAKTVRFWHNPKPRQQEASNPEINAGSQPKDSDIPEPAIGDHLRFAWVPLGEICLDSDGKLRFPGAPKRPGLYRFNVKRESGVSTYIGETDNLRRRFNHYRNPGPSQATNQRINELFRNKLREGSQIIVAIITDEAGVQIRGDERRVEFFNKSDRVLIEHAALSDAASGGDEILNK